MSSTARLALASASAMRLWIRSIEDVTSSPFQWMSWLRRGEAGRGDVRTQQAPPTVGGSIGRDTVLTHAIENSCGMTRTGEESFFLASVLPKGSSLVIKSGETMPRVASDP